jgi:hypothetical protein
MDWHAGGLDANDKFTSFAQCFMLEDKDIYIYPS